MSQNKENLPIFGIAKSKTLNDFCTSQSDVSRGISRMPFALARIYEEDTKFATDSVQAMRMSPSQHTKIDFTESEKLISNLSETMKHRNAAKNRASQRLDTSAVDDETNEEFSFDQLSKEHSMANASQVWRRDTLIEASLEDFELLSIIGHGTFGKVYLVRQRRNKKLFAMKCIRKDIVIEHESLDSLAVEKLILLQVNHPFIIGMDYVFQKPFRIYFIMDFIQGGELFKHLSDCHRFAEEKAKFYAA
jgi:hypothetical protein